MISVPPRLSQPAVHDTLYQIVLSIVRSDALVSVRGCGISTADLLVFGLGRESFVERIYSWVS